MSQHIYTRTLVADQWDTDLGNLSREVAVALPGKQFTISADETNLSVDFADTLSAGNVTTLDATVASHQAGFTGLPAAKERKIKEIDARTDELIAAGFTYASKQFSLSIPAQNKMVGTHQVKDDPALTYPINWNTIDDLDVYPIANPADLHGFYLTGLGTIRAHLDSGTALKDSVRAAVDIAAVEAVEDNR